MRGNVINNILRLLTIRNITVKKFAEDLMVTEQTVNALINEKLEPSLELALNISDYFALPLTDVFALKKEQQ